MAPPISELLNRCLHEGEFPRIWKHARISPIPKVPGINLVNEFSPFSVLPVLSKIAEKWLKCILRPFIMDRITESIRLCYRPSDWRCDKSSPVLCNLWFRDLPQHNESCPGLLRHKESLWPGAKESSASHFTQPIQTAWCSSFTRWFVFIRQNADSCGGSS